MFSSNSSTRPLNCHKPLMMFTCTPRQRTCLYNAPTGCTPRGLSGPLNRLNAILSLLHHLDRYRTPSAIGRAIGRPLSRPISHPTQVGVLNRLVLNRLGAQMRNSGAIVSQTSLKQARNKNAMEAAILNRILDRD